MSARMKVLLKSLRHISHLFDAKEREMQIGYPTDVKHVAHIGWDSNSLHSPSWMGIFHSGSESSRDMSSVISLGGLHSLSPSANGSRRIPRRKKQRQKKSGDSHDVDSPRQEPPQNTPSKSRRKKASGSKSKFWVAPPDLGEESAVVAVN